MTSHRDRSALVVGDTGLTGCNVAEHLVEQGWDVSGLSRRDADIAGVRHVSVDLLDSQAIAAATTEIRATHAMNMGVTLAVYGTICRETGAPFVFPGSPVQYDGTTDITGARLLAKHLTWAATSKAAANEAFNVVNGDTFSWRQMWDVVASGLGVAVTPYPGRATPLVTHMEDAPDTWRRIARRADLAEPDVDRLAPWWHTDGDLGRTIEAYADMTKSREAGFTDVQDSRHSFLDLFDRLRQERIIPSEVT